jgi:sugar (pentulose or hexulose) kinase
MRSAQELKERFPELWQSIAGVGVTGQGDGMWPVDAQGQPVGRAMLWNDTRTRDFGIERDAQLSEFLISKSSTALFAGAFPVLLKWLKQNAPSDYARIAHVLHCKDWLNFRLTDVLASDYSDQSTASIDIFTKEYVPELFDRLGIPEMKAALPTLYPSTHVLGSVTTEAEQATGIPASVPVVTGCIDVAAVALGTGMDKLGDGCCILGTTLCCELLLSASQVNVTIQRSAPCSVLPDK